MTQTSNSSEFTLDDVNHWPWTANELVLTGSIFDDRERLEHITIYGESALQCLPAKRDRSEAQQRFADAVLEHGRQVREAYLRQYGQSIYDILTKNGKEYLRLDELLDAISERFPGVMPSKDILSAEFSRRQADKEGLEIDLGIIIRAFLRLTSAGSHLMDAMLRPTSRALSLLPTFRTSDRIELETVMIERREDVGYITLQNPEHLNAENERLVEDLETAIDIVLLDDRILVGTLRGGTMTHPKYAGRRVFCSGINLKSLCAGKIGLISFLLTRELGLINKLRSGLLLNQEKVGLERLSQKPWIAAVESFAIGGGMQLLFAFDHVIAEEDSYFSLPAASEGIVPGAANFRITRQMGSRLARRVILSGHHINASDAEATLICDEVVNSDDIEMALTRAAKAFVSPAVTANRMMLNMAEEPPETFRTYMAEFAVAQARRAYSADVLEKLNRRWSL